MPSILDIFDGSGYQVAELTAAINKLPFVPGRLGKSGLFKHQGVTTTTVMIERNRGKIALIPTKTRGGGGTTKKATTKRDLRPFVIPHIPYDDSLYADAIQGVRAFGTTDRLETINTLTNDKLQGLRQDQEVTHEYHRVGAIQGVVLDADGTTEIFDLFDEFDITREVVDFELDDPLTKVKMKCEQVRRIIEGKLGGLTYTGIEAQVGDGFWDALISHDTVAKAFERYQDNAFARTSQREGDVPTFEFCGIKFQNYRGKVGNINFVGSTEANFYPTGIPDLFVHYSAPADFIETVNTIGQPVYVKQERMKFDKGVEFHSQSNPAILCTRPEVLVGGTTALPEDIEEVSG